MNMSQSGSPVLIPPIWKLQELGTLARNKKQTLGVGPLARVVHKNPPVHLQRAENYANHVSIVHSSQRHARFSRVFWEWCTTFRPFARAYQLQWLGPTLRPEPSCCPAPHWKKEIPHCSATIQLKGANAAQLGYLPQKCMIAYLSHGEWWKWEYKSVN